jgi:glycosyltransferase involved in cell wall biosynthesis
MAFEERANVVTLGNFRHPPNADAVQFLAERVWPEVRRLDPSLQMKVYGAYPTPEVKRYHSPEMGFHVLGPVERPSDIFESARVALHALRFGAGIKGKVIDSWASGTPVVCTPTAAEGMTDDEPFPGIVRTTPEELARAVVDLYSNKEVWSSIQGDAFQMVQKKYLREPGLQKIKDDLMKAYREKEGRRERNWVGRILLRESMRSGLYFSRWIELKEKLNQSE